MRLLVTAGTAAGFVLLCAMIVVGGRSLGDQQATVIVDEIDDLPEGMFDEPAETAPAEDTPEDTVSAQPAESGEPAGAAKVVEGEPAVGQDGLERVEPREPLSELSQALPPGRQKPVPPGEWKSTRLFNPVAAAAGIVEAQGYQVALAGVEPTPLDEECSFEGRTWPCGTQARTAFRAWLRARAVQCVVPPEPDRQLITAECNVGKDDLGAWLVTSGWARAAAGSPYAEAGQKAEAEKKGLFGAPPKPIDSLPTPNLPTSSIQVMPDQPILNDSGEAPATPSILDGAFPPAPTNPSQ